MRRLLKYSTFENNEKIERVDNDGRNAKTHPTLCAVFLIFILFSRARVSFLSSVEDADGIQTGKVAVSAIPTQFPAFTRRGFHGWAAAARIKSGAGCPECPRCPRPVLSQGRGDHDQTRQRPQRQRHQRLRL